MTNGEAKLGAFLVPTVAVMDWRWSAALAFGLISGWFCRAAIPYMNRRPFSEIRRDFIVSVMISGGSLLATLWLARMMEADTLSVGVIAWAVSFGGIKSLSLVYDYIWLPIRNTIGKSPEEIMGERRQEAQRRIAATKIALKDSEAEAAPSDETDPTD